LLTYLRVNRAAVIGKFDGYPGTRGS